MKYYSSFEITAENCLNNRAINYGDGVFETMLIENNSIALWNFHWQRLKSSLESLGLEPLDQNYIYSKSLSLADDSGSYILKLLVFRDDKKRGYSSNAKTSQFFITLNPYKKTPVSPQITRSFVELSRQKKLAGLKHLNRLDQVLAAQSIIDSKYTDAIMCDDAGNIIETISKNIILFRNHKIYSPSLIESGVHGVALRWLESQGHEINWKKIEFNELAQYHGMMTCNSIQGFSPIYSIDEKKYFDKQTKLSGLIQTQWDEKC